MQPAQHLQAISPSYIREILRAATAADVVSLAGGLPAEDCFPMSLLKQPLQQISQSPRAVPIWGHRRLPAIAGLVLPVLSAFRSANRHDDLWLATGAGSNCPGLSEPR